MNTEHRLNRLEQTLGTLISWLPMQLGEANIKLLLDGLRAPEDSDNLEGPPRTPEELAQNARELDAVAPTPADKFQLMFGVSERDALLDRFAHALAACLTTYPDLRVEEVHEPLFVQWKKLRKIS